jgi:hypothetical protein
MILRANSTTNNHYLMIKNSSKIKIRRSNKTRKIRKKRIQLQMR